MMVISQMEFRKYLVNVTDPPSAMSLPCLSVTEREGECDVLIIHYTFGIIVGEIKASDFEIIMAVLLPVWVIKKGLICLGNQERSDMFG
jgi:hypothetical protein